MSENNKFFSSHRKWLKLKGTTCGIILSFLFVPSPLYPMAGKPKKTESAMEPEYWVHRGFADFSQGSIENGGANLYINANGVIEMINNYDVNNDGYVDLVLSNDHDKIERGPTWAFIVDDDPGENWKRYEMSADSGWTSRVADVDADGYQDLITVNSYNGVTSEFALFHLLGGAGWTGGKPDRPADDWRL